MITAEQILRGMLRPLIDPTGRLGTSGVDEFINTFKQRVQNECQQLDGKRNFLMWHRKDGRETTGAFILIPQDELAIPTLRHYKRLCMDEGCGEGQIAGTQRVIERFHQRVKEEDIPVKLPDLKTDDNAQ